MRRREILYTGAIISEKHFASIFNVGNGLAGSSTNVFAKLEYLTSHNIFHFTSLNRRHLRLELLSAYSVQWQGAVVSWSRDRLTPTAPLQRTNGESEADTRQRILEYASPAEWKWNEKCCNERDCQSPVQKAAAIGSLAVIVRPAIWMYNSKKERTEITVCWAVIPLSLVGGRQHLRETSNLKMETA
jgi:hypothetical protein